MKRTKPAQRRRFLLVVVLSLWFVVGSLLSIASVVAEGTAPLDQTGSGVTADTLQVTETISDQSTIGQSSEPVDTTEGSTSSDTASGDDTATTPANEPGNDLTDPADPQASSSGDPAAADTESALSATEQTADTGDQSVDDATNSSAADSTGSATQEAPSSTETAGVAAALEDSSTVTATDPLENEPAQVASIVNVEDANLTPSESAQVQALVDGSSGEVTVQAALVPVVQGPEEVVAVLVGEGITYSNIAYTGAPNAIGTFTGGSGIIGFESGVILSSGVVTDVVGPNDESGKGTSHGTAGDADLNALVAPYTTADAAVLTFDFQPAGNKVVFSYVFSSEEYNEYVGSQYNDVFAFYINGENCATVDGGRVSINSINNDTNSEFFIDNTDGHLNTEMDGMTVVLTCEANVTAGQTNTIKLAIADTSDTILDSNVFIQAKSFVVPTPTATVTPPTTATLPATTTATVYPTQTPELKHTYAPVMEPGVVVVVKTQKVDLTNAQPASKPATKLPNTGVGHDSGLPSALILALTLSALASGLGAIRLTRRQEH